MKESAHINQEKFQALVKRQGSIAITLTILTLVIYYGFILILAFDSSLLAAKVGPVLTLGIVVGFLVIVASSLLTGIYVFWANSNYDHAVQDILKDIRG